MKVVAVIPAFNEQETIAKVVPDSKRFVDEVVVVDDGSTDETFREAQEAHVVRHQVKRGKGDALRTGFAEALRKGAEIIVTLDADGQHDPREIPKIIQPVLDGRADLVVGRREGALMFFSRRLSNTLCSSMLTLFGLELYDTQCGFRAYSRQAVLLLLQRSKKEGYIAETEFLVEAKKFDLEILDVPIRTIQPSKSSIRAVRDTAQFLSFILRKLFASLRLKLEG